MTDPLSVAAGVAGLISLGIQVTESLVAFYTSYKGQDSEITWTTDKLEGLLNTFRFLSNALQNRQFRPDEQDLVKNIESSIQQCDELIRELQDDCQEFNKASTSGIRGAIKIAGRRMAYPFRRRLYRNWMKTLARYVTICHWLWTSCNSMTTNAMKMRLPRSNCSSNWSEPARSPQPFATGSRHQMPRSTTMPHAQSDIPVQACGSSRVPSLPSG